MDYIFTCHYELDLLSIENTPFMAKNAAQVIHYEGLYATQEYLATRSTTATRLFASRAWIGWRQLDYKHTMNEQDYISKNINMTLQGITSILLYMIWKEYKNKSLNLNEQAYLNEKQKWFKQNLSLLTERA